MRKKISLLTFVFVFLFSSFVSAAPQQSISDILKEYATQASKIEANLLRANIGVYSYKTFTDSNGVYVQATMETGITDVDTEFKNIALIASKINSFNRVISRTDVVMFRNNEMFYLITVPTKETKQYIDKKITLESFVNTWRFEPISLSSTTETNKSAIISKDIYLYSNDKKTYLGKLTPNEYDKDSIFNEYGTYGSAYSSKSIWNEYGTYGGKYSSQSAFNEFATKPPVIVYDGEVIGYLTVNKNLKDAISPIGLKKNLEDMGIK